MQQVSPIGPERASPSMFLYSLPFALVYIGGAIALGLLVTKFGSDRPGSLSYFGHLLAVGGALLSAWLFVKRHQRLFSPKENARVVAFCICWVLLLEVVGLTAHPEILSLPASILIGVLAFGFGFDALIVWASFRYGVRRAFRGRVPESTSTDALPANRQRTIKPYMLGAAVVLVIAAGAAFLPKSLVVSPIKVTVADVPRILSKVSASKRTPAFAVFTFTTPDRPNDRDAVNLQFSLENGRPGFDWVLVSPRNIEDKASFIGFASRRGYTVSERKMNGVTYLRVEDGDLVRLCTEVITGLYARPRSEAMDLIVQGFDWNP